MPAIDVWARTLGRWGITPSTRVVVYDAAGGANAAARAWWMLRAVGHAEVAVLDGGFDAAVEAGFAVDDAPPSVAPVTPYPVSAWRLPTVDIHDVERVRNDPSKRVVDVRAAERFRGEVETFDPIAGHIPGAINVPYAENLDPHGMFRAPLELAEHYRAVFGDVGAEHVVVHCGSGVTACHTLLALDLAGIRGAALYVGSWSEWCRTDRPKAPSRP